MNKIVWLTALVLTIFLTACSGETADSAPSAQPKGSAPTTSAAPPEGELPVKGMVTMIDLGADKCFPCKMMAPIIEEVKNEYRDRAAVVFLDVWKDPTPARRFGIRAIPTQIFFDPTGREVYRHEGFLSKEAIKDIFARLGVK